MKLTDGKLWTRAYNGDPSILSDPRVNTLKDECGHTPLHWLAYKGVREVLKHPDFDKVKNNYGQTPKDICFLYKQKPETCPYFI